MNFLHKVCEVLVQFFVGGVPKHHLVDTVDGSEIRLASWYGEYPMFQGVSYIAGGAGFLNHQQWGKKSSATPDVGETPSPAMLNIKALASRAFLALQIRLCRLSELAWCDGDAPKHKDNYLCHEAPKKKLWIYNTCWNSNQNSTCWNSNHCQWLFRKKWSLQKGTTRSYTCTPFQESEETTLTAVYRVAVDVRTPNWFGGVLTERVWRERFGANMQVSN